MEAAFFDLDKTVIAKASMVAFGRPLYDAGMISRWLVVRAMWSNTLFHYLGADEERMRKFRASALRITAGWDQALISAIVRDTLIDVIEPIVYDEALDLIRQHQAAGRRVFIISASPEEIVAPLAQYLGVDEAIASRAQLDDQGRYTGDVEFWSYGPYKAEAMIDAAERLGIDLQASYAYSDSATDIPMLEVVGHPVAVNPDRDLARVAAERDWEVRHFEHGVPLRQRVTMPPPGKTVAAIGVVSSVAVSVAIVWWWLNRRPTTIHASAEAPARGAWRAASSVVDRPPIEGRRVRAAFGLLKPGAVSRGRSTAVATPLVSRFTGLAGIATGQGKNRRAKAGRARWARRSWTGFS